MAAESDPTRLAAIAGAIVAVLWLVGGRKPEGSVGFLTRLGGAALIGGGVGAAVYFFLR